MGIRFIGNKQRLLPFLIEKITSHVGRTPLEFADLFTGTASVARAFKREGSRVIANDRLMSSVVSAEAALLVSEVPKFRSLLSEEDMPRGATAFADDPLDQVLEYLNELAPIEGFFCREYAPSGSAAQGTLRQYFTDDNAGRIDAIRTKIRTWWVRGLISSAERALLLSSLMMATNDVANVAGTYGCFLRTWYDRALVPLQLRRPIITSGRTDHEIYHEDANHLSRRVETQVVYLDPPYTKRQYDAYYHVLETLAADDEPQVWGITGLRPRQGDEWASDYCYKKRAAKALEDLVKNVRCEYLFVSYSSDGHIAHDELVSILEAKGPVEVWSVPLQRYKSNNGGSKMDVLKERLYGVSCR